ncbi:MAG: nicotinamide mononucleotide transporter [Saprospiraceae bacterium]|nr:nicotinamide mononucleotide transporter [Saprospiraceae bacterium]MCB0625518.1 nicotinamide mononucleotide transporter [Saprospiraceae bacterium]
MDTLSIGQAVAGQIANTGWPEWVAIGGAILYLVLAARESPWCWFWGIISCAFWAYVAYAEYALFVDALLQVFYVLISFWGLYAWLYGGQAHDALPIGVLPLRSHVGIILAGLLLTLVVGYFFDQYTPAAATYPDAFTTVFSVIATFMVIYKKLENWLYWLVIDTVYLFLYGSRGGYLFVLLFVVYLVLAVVGYLRWRREFERNLNSI